MGEKEATRVTLNPCTWKQWGQRKGDFSTLWSLVSIPFPASRSGYSISQMNVGNGRKHNMKVCSSRWCNSCKSLPPIFDKYLIANAKSFLCGSYGIIQKNTKTTGSHYSRVYDIIMSRWHLCSWSASIHCCPVSTQSQLPFNTKKTLITWILGHKMS